jgi:hypothetical protein
MLAPHDRKDSEFREIGGPPQGCFNLLKLLYGQSVASNYFWSNCGSFAFQGF